MGTRSTIAIKQKDGKYKQIYCHWDGYLSHNGNVLLNHYNTPEKVKELIALGDLSILDKNIGEKIDFEDSELREKNEQCLAYHRDREEDYFIKIYHSDEDFRKNSQTGEYDYLFDETTSKWSYKTGSYEYEELTQKICD